MIRFMSNMAEGAQGPISAALLSKVNALNPSHVKLVNESHKVCMYQGGTEQKQLFSACACIWKVIGVNETALRRLLFCA